MGLAATYYLTSSALTFTGFLVADLIMKKKKGERLSLKNIATSAYHNLSDAAINGPGQELMYTGIDALPNTSFLQKIIKTLTFNPIVAAGYQLFYQAHQYIRSEIGYVKAIGALLNPQKAKEYLKDFYDVKLKGQYLGKVWTVFKRVFPIHFASINYITEQTLPNTYMPLRMGIAANNDVIFAMASKPDKKK
ncbi:MAG: hypothetical protein GXP63_03570 [DPANN group archaeon]|nr:hypothetical protein [DPANN group archaeon]